LAVELMTVYTYVFEGNMLTVANRQHVPRLIR